jgi:hypothetical protein
MAEEKNKYSIVDQDEQVRTSKMPAKPSGMRDDEFERKESERRGWEPSCGTHIIQFLKASNDLTEDNTRFARRKHSKGPCEPKFCSKSNPSMSDFNKIAAYENFIAAKLGRQMGDTFDL